MSKLTCTCGYVILDQSDLLPYKAELFADQDSERLWDGAADEIADYVGQTVPSRRRWLADRLDFRGAGDPSMADAVFHILVSVAAPLRREMLECQNCGTLWLQAAPGDTRYRGYAPTSQTEPGVLRSSAK